MASEANRRATKRYIKQKTRQFMIRCNKETEADIIEKLEGIGNVNAYVKGLVRKDCREASANDRVQPAEDVT